MRQRMFKHLKGRITRINDQKPFNKFIHWISGSIYVMHYYKACSELNQKIFIYVLTE